MIITSKDLFEMYTKTEQKTGFIQKKAKELNVPRSSVIAALLMSGYKLDEIRRSDENNYKAGLNKYNKWIKDGKPEQTFEVPEVAPVVKEKKKYEKPVLRETEEMSKHPVPEELERAVNENLSEKPEPVIVSEPETVEEKPKSVDVSADKGESVPENELDNAKLRLRIIDLESELNGANLKIHTMEDCTEKYNKLLTDYNIVSADFETVQNTMAAEYQRRLAVEAKLRKAERIICDKIYEDMPDEAE